MTSEQMIAAIDDAAHSRVAHMFDVLCAESIGQDDEIKRQALSRFRSGLKSIQAAYIVAVSAVDDGEEDS